MNPPPSPRKDALPGLDLIALGIDAADATAVKAAVSVIATMKTPVIVAKDVEVCTTDPSVYFIDVLLDPQGLGWFNDAQFEPVRACFPPGALTNVAVRFDTSNKESCVRMRLRVVRGFHAEFIKKSIAVAATAVSTHEDTSKKRRLGAGEGDE